MRERTRLEGAINTVIEAEQELSDSVEMIELAEMEDDAEMVEEAVGSLNQLAERMRRAQLETLLSGEADGNDAFVEIHSGAGGTESQDWAAMLARMYARWANAHDYKVEIMEEQAGEEAGLKSTTMLVKGENAYGWLKTEAGVHRLVRISPFDSSARRHTSFSSVGVYPQIDDAIEVDIDESKVRTDTYRASGAGGQHINKTDSAVRLTYDKRLWCSARMTAPSTRTGRGPGTCCAPGSTRSSFSAARPPPRRWPTARAKLVGGIRSAPTYCNPIRW